MVDGLAEMTETPAMKAPDPKIQAKNAKRPSRAAEPIGAVHPREITKIRDEVGRIRDMTLEADPVLENVTKDLNELYSAIDRLDLRYRIHHDQAPKKKAAR